MARSSSRGTAGSTDQPGVEAEQVVSVDQGADVFVESMNANGVDYLFINSGTDTYPIQESMAKFMAQGRRVPQTILCLDEAVAMAAAHGHFMISGRPQVLLVHVDAGTLQVGGGLHNAQRGRVGMIFCAGRAPYTADGEVPGSKNLSIHWIQEQLDQAGAVRGFTKWDYEIRRQENIQQVMQRAFQVATSEPSGPVYVTLPREVLLAPMETAAMPAVTRHAALTTPQADPECLAEAAAVLASAERPLIIIGQAGRHPQIVPHLVELAEMLGAPVSAEPVRLSFPSTHPLSAGRAADTYLKEADAILLVDCDIPYIPVNAKPRPDARIISIDQDPVKNSIPMWVFPADYLIQADSSKAIPALVFEVRSRMTADQSRAAEARRASIGEAHVKARGEREQIALGKAKESPIAPEWLAYCIGKVLDEDTIVLNETVTNAGNVLAHLPRSKPGTLYSSGGSSLGWALGAALGARLAAPDRTVAAIVADGAFTYGCPTSVYWAADKYNIPFLTVIFNNQRHTAPKNALLAGYPDGYSKQTDTYLGTEIFPSPEYALIAQACRAYGETVEDPSEVEPALRRGLERVKAGQAAVIDVRLARS
ncbi:MAG: thiamine pyrophosphate-requiring protein [Dehalococcoidia bacterium]